MKYQISNIKYQKGFTLMEIVVATTIFAVVVAAMMSMFNYTLRINRRTEALRQASQTVRDLVEFLAKEIRNGQFDYRTPSSLTGSAPTAVGPCGSGGFPDITRTPPGAGNPMTRLGSTYGPQDNKFAIQTPEGQTECFYLAYGQGETSPGNSIGDYAGPGVYAKTADNQTPALAIKKGTLPVELLTTPNVSIQRLQFLVRPTCDPNWGICEDYSLDYPNIQPFVTIAVLFQVKLPTGEKSDLYYQTTVASNKYDIPLY